MSATNSSLLNRILEIRNKDYTLNNERDIEQSIILPILHNLGWDIFNTEQVKPQYSIDNRRVDYSLRLNNENKVFIEVKKTSEELERHQDQILNYAFASGVSLAILTNGIDWWFFLPLLKGHWSQRKFYSINLKSQKEEEIVLRFEDFLSKQNIGSDKAIQLAKESHENASRKSIVLKTIPEVWNEIIKLPNDLLIQLLIDETEKKCAYAPDKETISQFLKTVSPSNSLLPIANIPKKEYSNDFKSAIDLTVKDDNERVKSAWKNLKVVVNDSEPISERNAIQTMIKVVEYFGVNNVQEKVRLGGKYPLILTKDGVKTYPNGRYTRMTDNIHYIYSLSSTPQKKDTLEKVAKQLNLSIKVDLI